MAFINNRPPFSMENDDGEIEGIIVDLVSRIRESSGLNLQYTMLESGQRVVDYLEKHPEDLAAGVIVENPAFTKLIIWYQMSYTQGKWRLSADGG